jgi:hypothetical protein
MLSVNGRAGYHIYSFTTEPCRSHDKGLTKWGISGLFIPMLALGYNIIEKEREKKKRMAIGPWVSTVSPELLAIKQPEIIRLL